MNCSLLGAQGNAKSVMALNPETFIYKNTIILLCLLGAAFAVFNPSLIYAANGIDEYVPSPQSDIGLFIKWFELGGK